MIFLKALTRERIVFNIHTVVIAIWRKIPQSFFSKTRTYAE